MHDVKGRHNLITWGWTKLDAHVRSGTSVFKTTTVLFWGEYGVTVLPLSLQSAIYSCPRRTSRFLESVAKTRTTTTLVYNTQQITLRFTAAVASSFHAIVATRVLGYASIMSSERCGWDSVHARAQLSRVYLASTLDIMHVIKCTRLSPSLAGRAWEGG